MSHATRDYIRVQKAQRTQDPINHIDPLGLEEQEDEERYTSSQEADEARFRTGQPIFAEGERVTKRFTYDEAKQKARDIAKDLADIPAYEAGKELYQKGNLLDKTIAVIGITAIAVDQAVDIATLGKGGLGKLAKEGAEELGEKLLKEGGGELLERGARKADDLTKTAVKELKEAGEKAGKVGAPKGANNPKVRESLEKGKVAHKEFAEKVKQKPGWKSEPQNLVDPKTGKKVIPDAVTPSGRPIELKPNTPSGKVKGSSQLKKYERATGQKGRVVYYDDK